jgi:hypothetical protein
MYCKKSIRGPGMFNYRYLWGFEEMGELAGVDF